MKRRRSRKRVTPAGAKGFNKAAHAEVAERRARAWKMRLAGAPYRQIGAALGVSWKQARKYIVQRLQKLAEVEDGCAREMRVLETERLDRLLSKLQRGIRIGDPVCIGKAIAISDRKARLWGLDAPTKIAPTTPDGERTYDPLDELTDEELNKRAARVLEFERKLRAVRGGAGGAEADGEGEGVDAP